MEKENALLLIKQVLDVATKRGVIENIESAAAVYTAFNLINDIVNKPAIVQPFEAKN